MGAKLAVKEFLSFTAIGLASIVTVACTPIETLNTFIPDDGYHLYANIAYGNLSRQKLDVYKPIGHIDNNKQKTPVIIFYYGGSWDSGNKSDYKFVAEAFTSKGFLTVVPDYRVYPEVKFPAFMADPAKAAKWVKNNIQDFGGDSGRVFLAGHSAGAHIAVMLSLNGEYLEREHLKPNDFRGTLGLAGPYDFLPLKSDRLKEIFGPEDQRWKSQPIEYVTGNNQPMLLLVGLKDSTVWTRNTFNLAAKIKSKGGEVDVVEFPTYGHIDMAAKLAKPFRGDGCLLTPMVDFINSH
jgi:acetyl esterase/lipase